MEGTTCDTCPVRIRLFNYHSLEYFANPFITDGDVERIGSVVEQYANTKSIKTLIERLKKRNDKELNLTTGTTNEKLLTFGFLNEASIQVEADSVVLIVFSDNSGMLLCVYDVYMGWIASKNIIQTVVSSVSC